MSEVTYDALRKRLATAEAENARLKDAIHDLAKHISRWDWWSLKPETHALVGEKE